MHLNAHTGTDYARVPFSVGNMVTGTSHRYSSCSTADCPTLCSTVQQPGLPLPGLCSTVSGRHKGLPSTSCSTVPHCQLRCQHIPGVLPGIPASGVSRTDLCLGQLCHFSHGCDHELDVLGVNGTHSSICSVSMSGTSWRPSCASAPTGHVLKIRISLRTL